MTFKMFLLTEESRTAAKSGLYPLGYGGIGLYPPQWWIAQAADAVLYITQDERLYNNGDGPPFDIRHIPGHKQWGDHVNNGTDCPFSIKNVPGCEPHANHNTAGDGKPFSLKNLSN